MVRLISHPTSEFISYLSWLENSFRFGDFSRGFVGHFLSAVSIEHAEEVIVWSGHDGGIVPVPAALELVENAIVFVQRTQFRTQVLMHLITRKTNHDGFLQRPVWPCLNKKYPNFSKSSPPQKKSSHGSLCFISDVFKITSIVTKDLDYFSKKIYHTEFFKNGPIWSHWHRLRQVLIAHRMPLSFCGRGFEFIRN